MGKKRKPRKPSFQHRLLFSVESPFKPHCVESKKKYKRNPKHKGDSGSNAN